MLTNEAQQTVLVISSYWIYLLFITGDVYHKELRIKAYSDILKINVSKISDYAKVKLFHPPRLCAICEHYLHQKMGSNSL